MTTAPFETLNTKTLAKLARKALDNYQWVSGNKSWMIDESRLTPDELESVKDIAESMGIVDSEVLLCMAFDAEGESLPGQHNVAREKVSFSVNPPFDERLDGYTSVEAELDGSQYRLLLRECFRQGCSLEEITRQALVQFVQTIEGRE